MVQHAMCGRLSRPSKGIKKKLKITEIYRTGAGKQTNSKRIFTSVEK